MDSVPPSKAANASPDASVSRVKDSQTIELEQRLRKRRLGMSFASYSVTFTVVLFFWYQQMIPASVAGHFALYSLLINGGLWLLIHSNLNLRLRDPSMTALQMIICQWPALWVMFFLEAGQARAIFLLITIVPALYGILALNVRQFIWVSLGFLIQYSVLHLALWTLKPQAMNAELELIQSFAFILVLAEVALIGGFISGLRGKLRLRNHELKNAMARIQELVNIDELTGIYNRRRIFQVLSEESNRYQRAPGAFSLGILDVDFFKHINDSHGHQAGDEILRKLASCVSDSLRVIDSFGRYGGEEFLLILPQTTLAGAQVKAERIRASIEALRFESLPEGIRVTVSIGLAEFQAGETTDDTLARADKALYQAKEAGRNRVIGAENKAAEV
ncbi:MAG: GGDEF domain-containing protein [Pseudoalteromonas distincta]